MSVIFQGMPVEFGIVVGTNRILSLYTLKQNAYFPVVPLNHLPEDDSIRILSNRSKQD